MNFISAFNELEKLYENDKRLQEKAVGRAMSTANRTNVGQKDGNDNQWVTHDPETGDTIIGKDTKFKMVVYAVPKGSEESYKKVSKEDLYTDAGNNSDDGYGFESNFTNILERLDKISKTHDIRKLDVWYYDELGKGMVQCFGAQEQAGAPTKVTVALNAVFDEKLPFMKNFNISADGRLGHKVTITEAVEDEEIEIVDDEPKQTIIECSKCGALVIVDEVEVDEESDLVNIKDECKFCEEKEGYKIIGSVLPYEEAEADEEPVEEEEPVDEEPVEDELAEEDDIIDEDLADIARKVFDKPASTTTQQRWEDELNGEMGEISDKRRKHLERKFAQQRDWEARHANDGVKAGTAASAQAGAVSSGEAGSAVAGVTAKPVDELEELPELESLDEARRGTAAYDYDYVPGSADKFDHFEDEGGPQFWNGGEAGKGVSRGAAFAANSKGNIRKSYNKDSKYNSYDASYYSNDPTLDDRLARESLDEDELTEGFSVKYGRGGESKEFSSLEDAVKHINDGMKNRDHDSFVLYQDGEEMIWLDWYTSNRDGSESNWSEARSTAKSPVAFDRKTGTLSIKPAEETQEAKNMRTIVAKEVAKNGKVSLGQKLLKFFCIMDESQPSHLDVAAGKMYYNKKEVLGEVCDKFVAELEGGAKNESLEEVEEGIFGFGKKKGSGVNHYIGAMGRDRSGVLYTAEIGKKFEDAIRAHATNVTRSNRNYFASRKLAQFEFDCTANDLRAIENDLYDLRIDYDRYMTRDGRTYGYRNGRAEFDTEAKEAIANLFEFAVLKSNI